MDTVSLKARDPGVPPVAMMHWSRYNQDEWSNWEPENPMPVHGCPDLRVVDMMNDGGVCAILDEGLIWLTREAGGLMLSRNC